MSRPMLSWLTAGAVCVATWAVACGQGTGESSPPRLGPPAGVGGAGGTIGMGGAATTMAGPGPGSGGGNVDCSTAGDGDFESPTTEDVLFTSSTDGIDLFGRLYIPDPGGTFATVVLLHQVCADRTDWAGVSNLAFDLSRRGFLVLTYDARGHGQSTDGGTLELCNENDAPLFEPMVDDLGDALDYLALRPEANLDCLGVAGGSMGANVALIYAASDPRVQTAVLFSPGLNYFGLSTQNAIEDFDPRPSLMYAGTDDTYSANTLTTLGDASAAATTVLVPGAPHGASILPQNPDALEQTLTWFSERL